VLGIVSGSTGVSFAVVAAPAACSHLLCWYWHSCLWSSAVNGSRTLLWPEGGKRKKKKREERGLFVGWFLTFAFSTSEIVVDWLQV